MARILLILCLQNDLDVASGNGKITENLIQHYSNLVALNRTVWVTVAMQLSSELDSVFLII